jgi:hypothetical protein
MTLRGAWTFLTRLKRILRCREPQPRVGTESPFASISPASLSYCSRRAHQVSCAWGRQWARIRGARHSSEAWRQDMASNGSLLDSALQHMAVIEGKRTSRFGRRSLSDSQLYYRKPRNTHIVKHRSAVGQRRPDLSAPQLSRQAAQLPHASIALMRIDLGALSSLLFCSLTLLSPLTVNGAQDNHLPLQRS